MDETDEFCIPEEALEKLKDPSLLIHYMNEGKTFQEIIGYNNETMEKFYQAASRLFEKQAYKEAADAFIFLTTLNPYAHNFWLGLGMSEQLCGEFHAALRAYGMAIFTEPYDPLPHYHSATCYKELGNINGAIQSYELVIECCQDKEAFASLKTYAEEAKAKLKI